MFYISLSQQLSRNSGFSASRRERDFGCTNLFRNDSAILKPVRRIRDRLTAAIKSSAKEVTLMEFIKVVFFDLGNTLVKNDAQWNPPAKGVLSALKTAGVRLGIISNTAALTRAQLKQLLPSDFDFTVFESNLILLSSETGIEKPKVEVFELAITRSGKAPSECLYCSEDFQETLAAQRAGLLAARIQPPPDSDLGGIVDLLHKLKFLE